MPTYYGTMNDTVARIFENLQAIYFGLLSEGIYLGSYDQEAIYNQLWRDAIIDGLLGNSTD